MGSGGAAPEQCGSRCEATPVPYVDVADISLYYEERGRPDGPPVLMLHGGGGTIDDPAGGWALIARALEDGYRLILTEHRGHGRTGNPAGSMTFVQMADDVAAVLEHLGVTRAHVAGISDGGVMALDLALRRPGLVWSVVVIGTNYCVDEATLGAATGLDGDSLERQAPEAAAAFGARHDAGKYPGYWKDLIEAIKDNNRTNPSWAAEDLRKIACPVLLIAGEDDPFANTDQMMAMKREIPGAEWLIVNRSGHAVHHEHPEFVSARIRDFLDRSTLRE